MIFVFGFFFLMCSNLLFLKWKIWSMTWDVVLQELLLTRLYLQKGADLDSWALWASPRGALRVSEVFPPHPCWAPLSTAWLMQWRCVFLCSFDRCASLWDLGWRWGVRLQKTGSVLGKLSCVWDIRGSRCVILKHCSWELGEFCSLAGGKGCFLSALADPTADTVAGVALMFPWRSWLVCLIGTGGKWCSPWLLKKEVSAQAAEFHGMGNGALQFYPCQLASFPLLLFALVSQTHKARQPFCCPTASSDRHARSKQYTQPGVKPHVHWRALMKLCVPNDKYLSTAWWLSWLTVAFREALMRGETSLVFIPELYGAELEGTLRVI